MKHVAILMIVCVLHTASRVTAMTNREFLDLISEYATDVEVFDEDYDDSEWNSPDVIDLTGSLDDEVDLEPAITPLFNELNDDVYDAESDDLTFGQHELEAFRCSCRRGSCNCCGSHTFKARVFFKRIKFTLRACVSVALSRRNLAASITVTLNSRRVYRKTISLRNPPGMCFGVPGFKRFARICLKLYNIDFRRRKLCLKLTGTIDLKLKKFRANIKLGCISIPRIDENELFMATQGLTN